MAGSAMLRGWAPGTCDAYEVVRRRESHDPGGVIGACAVVVSVDDPSPATGRVRPGERIADVADEREQLRLECKDGVFAK